MAGRCNASQDAQDAWDAGDASLASGRNADGSDAGSVFADVPIISSHNIEASRGSSPGSVLSSAPSGLLTPTVGSNPREYGYTVASGSRIYERRKRIRKSWVYFPENGSEYTTVDGKTRWRCAQCKFHSTNISISCHST